MPFYEIEFPLAGLGADAVEAALQGSGASSITFVDRADEPVLEPLPGEMRLWSDTLVRALYDASTDPARTLSRLAVCLGDAITKTARVRGVTERVWERVWLDDWQSTRFGRRLWVCPTGADAPQDAQAVVVRLDPGLAFGTGTHPTTALCLEALDSLDLRGKSIIDYGCGSGILSIAALRLGAVSATCVDIDPQALLAARANAAINGVSARLQTGDGSAPLRPADCVLANILAGVLVKLADVLTAACRPGGELVLAGILHPQEEAVVGAYERGFDDARTRRRDDWSCIRMRRRSAPLLPGAL